VVNKTLKTYILIVLVVMSCFGVVSESFSADKSLIASAIEWLTLCDNKNYEGSWNSASPQFKRAISKLEWQKKMESIMLETGKTINRHYIKTLFPKKEQWKARKIKVVMFRTNFEKLNSIYEYVTLTNNSSRWQVLGYYISQEEVDDEQF